MRIKEQKQKFLSHHQQENKTLTNKQLTKQTEIQTMCTLELDSRHKHLFF